MPLPFFLWPVFYLVPSDVDRLYVESDPAVVSVARQQDGRQLIRLPELEFQLRIDAHCARGAAIQSLSISVADTRQTIAGEKFPANDVVATTVSVSPRQIAPIAVEEFCVADAQRGESRLLQTALTAQISLRCARNETQSVVFAAEPLDVRLLCATEEPAGTE